MLHPMNATVCAVTTARTFMLGLHSDANLLLFLIAERLQMSVLIVAHYFLTARRGI
jgi:hypothetical protein